MTWKLLNLNNTVQNVDSRGTRGQSECHSELFCVDCVIYIAVKILAPCSCYQMGGGHFASLRARNTLPEQFSYTETQKSQTILGLFYSVAFCYAWTAG